jgi:hypothetical protein
MLFKRAYSNELIAFQRKLHAFQNAFIFRHGFVLFRSCQKMNFSCVIVANRNATATSPTPTASWSHGMPRPFLLVLD